MMVDNLIQNVKLITEGKKYFQILSIIKSPLKIEKEINLGIIGLMIPLKFVDANKNKFFTGKGSVTTVDDLKTLYEGQIDKNLLIINIVDLDQREMKKKSTKLSEIVDSDIGNAITIEYIIKDLLNVISFSFLTYFSLESIFYPSEKIILSNLYSKIQTDIVYSNRINNNLNTLLNLRENQFKFLQKAFDNFNRSQYLADFDIPISLIVLISAIETLSQKYGKDKEDLFSEDIPFYNKLRKIIYNVNRESIIDGKHQELFETIGIGFMKSSYSRAIQKFKNFNLKFLPEKYKNDNTVQLLDDLYYMRSKIIHSGEDFHIINKNDIITFNKIEKGGKLAKDKNFDNVSRFIRIPSYNFLYEMFNKMTCNLVTYMYENRENTEDINLYIEGNTSRGTIELTINKTMKAGFIITNDDFYRSRDFIDLYLEKNQIKKH